MCRLDKAQDSRQVRFNGHRLRDRNACTSRVPDGVPTQQRSESRHRKPHELTCQLAKVMVTDRHDQHRNVNARVKSGGRLRENVRALEMEPCELAVALFARKLGFRELGFDIRTKECCTRHEATVSNARHARLNEPVAVVANLDDD